MLWVAEAWLCHGTMQGNETVPVGIMSIILSMKKDVSRYVPVLMLSVGSLRQQTRFE